MLHHPFLVSKNCILYCLCLITSVLYGQDLAYFQQKVSYEIAVTLDDEQHELNGSITIDYTNNSPDSLSYVYFHLWPNGYQHQQTAFAQQLLNQGRLDFHFTKKKNRGYIDSLAFECNGIPITYQENFATPDIAKLELSTAIKPGETVTFKTPFRVKIPENFSRLAHVDQAYMMCQWYPKPAVYDRAGWHPMSYLDQGEFYSEFGDFDVSITLPMNYVVGATGDLQTEQEKAFLEERAKASKKLNYKELAYEESVTPASAKEQKTIRYTAKNVHDFAWFADKRYHVQKGSVTLASGKEVTTYTMFNNFEADLWKDALDYTNRAVKFYSDIVGEYPYNSVTVAQGIYKGCDMEYPMVTVIGAAGYDGGLDNVITHEVGHNWFYGILGSNERDHPWMDEGWNTYMDARYMTQYYGYNTATEYLAYLYKAKSYEDQPIESRSQDLSSINYYICAYGKPTMSFRYLQEYLGTEELDRILKIYYNEWKFKHPQPDDLIATFKRESPKNLDWFFDNVIKTDQHIDYAATGYTCCNKHRKASITIENKGTIVAPIRVTALDEAGKAVEKVWVEGVSKDTTIDLNAEAVAYKIDAEEEMPEYNRNDNEIRTYGLIKKGEPVKFKLLGDFRNPDKPRINILPLLGFNLYDGVMIGAAVYNLPVPRRSWEYVVLPFFSTFTLAPTGMAALKHHHYLKKHRLTSGVSFKTFHKHLNRYTEERPFQFAERYYKTTLFGEFYLAKKSDISTVRHRLRLAHSLIVEEDGLLAKVDTNIVFQGKEVLWRSTHRLSYRYENRQARTPMNMQAMLEYANYNDIDERQHYLKLTLEANVKFMYHKLWGIDLRVFTGGFIAHTDRKNGQMPLLLIAGNRKDYHYDDHILGRRENENALAQQISLREGGFKTAIENIQYAGASNTFIFAINLKSDIPIKLPFRTKYVKLKPFLDIGYHVNADPTITITNIGQEIMLSGGIMIDIWDGAGGIYLPLFGTDNIENKIKSFVGQEFYKRITFSFNLSRIRPEAIAKEIDF